MDEKHTIEQVLSQFTAEEESKNHANVKASPANKVPTKSSEETPESSPETPRMTVAEEREARRIEIQKNLRERGLGWVPVPLEDLPSGGIFYPVGTKVNVRAASGGDIRHWSMMNETEITEIDNALNYIIERCVSITYGERPGTWKDLKEIDRFYLILTIRDFTFTEGHNELKIDVNEHTQVSVKKDNINFIEIPDNLMKYYDDKERCFVFKTKSPNCGDLHFHIPSVGVTQWLKSYVERKSRAQEPFDSDFITVAPILIRDYRDLNDKTYSDLIYQTMNYGVYEWSLIAKIKRIFETSVSPKMTYTDEEEGIEKETPLNFHGGIKAIFMLDMDEELDL